MPTFLAFAVTKLLEQHFARLVDYDFTARMEDDLDEIAQGDQNRGRLAEPLLYGGTDEEEGTSTPSSPTISTTIDARDVNSIENPAWTASCSASEVLALPGSAARSGQASRKTWGPTS